MVMVKTIANERVPSEVICTVGYLVEQVAGVEVIVRWKPKQAGE